MKQNLLNLLIVAAFVCLLVIGLFAYFYQSTGRPNTMNHGGHTMTVSSDQEFLIMMVPHHQEAVDTAKEVIARGGEVPEVRHLAENIISSQEKEIQQMKAWYREWFGTVLPETDTYVVMMRPLGSLSGKALDQQFVEDMIGHHEGAVSMSEQLQGFTTRSEMKTFAAQIITAQSGEIAEMKKWLVDIFKQSKIAS